MGLCREPPQCATAWAACMCSWLCIYRYSIEMHVTAWHDHITHWQSLSRWWSFTHTHTPIHQDTKAHTCTGSSLRPHSLHIEFPFISPYWLLLYPVAWLDHTRQHLTSSVFLPLLTHSQPPSLPHSPTHSSSSAPPTPFSCLPFISFHLSSLLNFTTGIRVWCFDGAAAPRHKSIVTPFTYFHANKWFAMCAIRRA